MFPHTLSFPIGWAIAYTCSTWFIYHLSCIKCYYHILAFPKRKQACFVLLFLSSFQPVLYPCRCILMYPTAQAASMLKHKLIGNKLFGGLFFLPGVAWKYLQGLPVPKQWFGSHILLILCESCFCFAWQQLAEQAWNTEPAFYFTPELECKWTWTIFKGNHSSVINKKVIMVASDTAGKHLQTLGTGNSLMRAKLYQTAHGLWGLKALASGVSMTSGLAWKLLLFRKYW